MNSHGRLSGDSNAELNRGLSSHKEMDRLKGVRTQSIDDILRLEQELPENLVMAKLREAVEGAAKAVEMRTVSVACCVGQQGLSA